MQVNLTREVVDLSGGYSVVKYRPQIGLKKASAARYTVARPDRASAKVASTDREPISAAASWLEAWHVANSARASTSSRATS